MSSLNWRVLFGLGFFLLGSVGCSASETTGPADINLNGVETIGQGVVVNNDGILIGDDELLMDTEDILPVLDQLRAGQRVPLSESLFLSQFLDETGRNFDAVELRIWGLFDNLNTEVTDVAWYFVQAAHAHGVKVYVNFWQYPTTLNVPEPYRAVRFNDGNQLVYTEFGDDHVNMNHIDKGNPEAMVWFSAQLREALLRLGDFDGFIIVEDKVASWEQGDSWPQRVLYWKSPTYSPACLASFQSFQQQHGWPVRGFPVDRPELVIKGLTELVGYAPHETLWLDWFQWKFELFAAYLKDISYAVKSVRNVPVVYMPWQRVVDECAEAYQGDWINSHWNVGFGPGVPENAEFGVSATAVSHRQAVDAFILEYGEDGTHNHWPMEQNRVNTERVAAALRGSPVTFGTFVQFMNYSDHRPIQPEWIEAELCMGLDNGSRIIVAYDVATVFSGSASRYNQEIAEYWRQVRGEGFRRLDSSVIAEVRTRIGGRKTLDHVPARAASNLQPPAGYQIPAMPSGVGAWYDQYDIVYVSAEVLNGPPPYYVVKDNWTTPGRCAPTDRLDDSTLPLGYIKIRRQDLTISGGFQVVSGCGPKVDDVLWAQIGETPGFCDKQGVKCRRSSWLFKPVSWNRINWSQIGWSPESIAHQ